MHENGSEHTVALDPHHDVAPVRMMQALQGSLEALQSQAARIAKNERTPTIAGADGVVQPVADEGGRHCLTFRAGRADTRRVLRREDPN